MPRFVLLRHECPKSLSKPSHWDLMFEHEGALLTWSLNELPPEWTNVSRDAVAERSSGSLPLEGRVREGVSAGYTPSTCDAPPHTAHAAQLPNHRLAYLDYEGPVSNNRGHVTRRDSGSYDLIEFSPDRLICTLHGRTLAAQVTLVRISHDQWTLTSHAPPT